jgi:hypothetical protein
MWLLTLGSKLVLQFHIDLGLLTTPPCTRWGGVRIAIVESVLLHKGAMSVVWLLYFHHHHDLPLLHLSERYSRSKSIYY